MHTRISFNNKKGSLQIISDNVFVVTAPSILNEVRNSYFSITDMCIIKDMRWNVTHRFCIKDENIVNLIIDLNEEKESVRTQFYDKKNLTIDSLSLDKETYRVSKQYFENTESLETGVMYDGVITFKNFKTAIPCTVVFEVKALSRNLDEMQIDHEKDVFSVRRVNFAIPFSYKDVILTQARYIQINSLDEDVLQFDLNIDYVKKEIQSQLDLNLKDSFLIYSEVNFGDVAPVVGVVTYFLMTIKDTYQKVITRHIVPATVDSIISS